MSGTTRQAIMTVSRQLLETVLPPGMVIDCYADKVGALDYGTLERPLLLPADACVTGVCVSGECFRRDQVLIRVACSAFREVELSEYLPDVQVHYERTPHGPRFVGWSGDAVGTLLGQPAGVPPRTVLEPWEKALVAGNFGHAPVMDAPFGKGPPDGTAMQYQLPFGERKAAVAIGPVELPLPPEECHCSCHAPNACMVHIAACCRVCPQCNKRIRMGVYEEHVQSCRVGPSLDEPKPVKFREFL